MAEFQLHFGSRAGCLKAFPNAMGSYHMSIAVQFTADGVRNFPYTVVCRLHKVSHGKAFQHHCPARIRSFFAALRFRKVRDEIRERVETLVKEAS